uniref:Mitochondrial glutamate carrier 2 n=1 Tax=Schmidtea mediterranea TaxID=79327 RepID=A0A0H3YJD3_SCHMD|nr:slc25a-26 [Schmidtea mediterranea]
MSQSADLNFSFLPKILNGGIAGIVGVTCVYPIDLVKTRLQNQQSGVKLYNGMFDCAKKTFKSEGFFKMYRGSAVNLFLITPEKAIKLVGNDFFRYHLKPTGKPLNPLREMIAGGGAGACQIIVTTPMELLKIQLQDEGRTRIKGQTGATKASASRIALNLLKEKGIFGLYKGMGATFLRDVTFSAIYFPLFANFNKLGPQRENGKGTVFYWSFGSGCLAGCIASLSVNPFDVVKTRLQTLKKIEGEQEFTGIFDCFKKTFTTEGWKAFFKGASCRIMVIAPLFGIAQTVYYLGVAEYLLALKSART